MTIFHISSHIYVKRKNNRRLVSDHRPSFCWNRGGEKLYFEKEELRQAKQMSAIEFLKRYRPEELVRCGTGEYELRSHDSFKISESTSLWHWKSRDIGGKSALDYLVRVEDVPFTDAVRYLLEQDAPAYVPCRKIEEHRPFVLPPAAREEYRVELYLQSRGISLDVIRYCVSRGILYESLPYHNCVFVGLDRNGIPRYAALRSTCDGPKAFKGEQAGSDKRHSFCIPPAVRSRRAAVYEAAPDALAHMTLEGGRADKYRLSLGGVYVPRDTSTDRPAKSPAALEAFLQNHPEVDELELCMDNDRAGRWAAQNIAKHYSKEYMVTVNLPPIEGYDWADMAKEEKEKRAARNRAVCLNREL